ncbi:TRAP transporter TatT component family protein [Candidatus Deferrimicrobium sp.]|uniref:TRAP transporter TatT component family protein n=1 Tax=Candidatus Deferrimicrobium sp. TaxID=3060586 RepID=UPI002ED525B7
MILAACFLLACSPRSYVISRMADAASSGGEVFARDDDPELVRDAVPFALKGMESLLASSPDHKGLLTALCKGFTQYAVAFVRQDAEEARDPEARRMGMERSRRLLLRARDYGVRGLSVDREGFAATLSADPVGAAARVGAEDVPLLYWTAAAWSLAVASSSDDPALLADLPRCEALMRRALALDDRYDDGAIHEFFVAFEGGRPEAMGGSVDRARRHMERAMALSGGRKVSPLVTFAETVSVRTQDRKGFLDLLDRALAFDARSAAPEHRMDNLVSQRRARWLKGRVDELFLD